MLRSPNNLLSFHVLNTLRSKDLTTRSRELHAISIYISLSVWHHTILCDESLTNRCRHGVTTKLNYHYLMQTMSRYNNNNNYGRDDRRNDDRRDERREDRRDNRKDDRRENSKAPQSSNKKANRSRSRSRTPPPSAPPTKARGGRSRSPSASPTTRDLLHQLIREKKSRRNGRSPSSDREPSRSHDRYPEPSRARRDTPNAPSEYNPGRPIVLPVQIADGVVYKVYDNPATSKRPANVTFTFQICRKQAFSRFVGLEDNLKEYGTKVCNDKGPICRDPYIQLPQMNAEDTKAYVIQTAQQTIRNHKNKVFEESPSKKPKPPPPEGSPQPKKTKTLRPMPVAETHEAQSDKPLSDDEKRTASKLLTMLFGLDSFQTSHFVLVALAEFFDVTVPNSTASLQGRLEAVTILTAALAQYLRGNGAGPQYDDIISRADVLEKNDRQMNPSLSRVTPISTPRNGTPDTVVIDVDVTAESIPKPRIPVKTPRTAKGKAKNNPEKNPNELKDTNSENGS